MVDLMAAYHGHFWGSPRLDNEFTWLMDASDWQRRLNVVQPELQPHAVCVANLQRLGQAAEDLQMLDAIGAG